MELTQFRSLIYSLECPSSPISRNVGSEGLVRVSLDLRGLRKRTFLAIVGGSAILSNIDHALAATESVAKELTSVTRTWKLASGVKIEEIVEGDGPEAKEGNVVEFSYVCRRFNGYFVHSTVNQFTGESNPVILPIDSSKMIEGLTQVLTGMKVGGKRRALIPPSVGYVNENLEPIPKEFGPRRSLLSHANEPLIFELRLLKIENF